MPQRCGHPQLLRRSAIQALVPARGFANTGRRVIAHPLRATAFHCRHPQQDGPEQRCLVTDARQDCLAKRLSHLPIGAPIRQDRVGCPPRNVGRDSATVGRRCVTERCDEAPVGPRGCRLSCGENSTVEVQHAAASSICHPPARRRQKPAIGRVGKTKPAMRVQTGRDLAVMSLQCFPNTGGLGGHGSYLEFVM